MNIHEQTCGKSFSQLILKLDIIQVLNGNNAVCDSTVLLPESFRIDPFISSGFVNSVEIP
jgi:hypothetical protein